MKLKIQNSPQVDVHQINRIVALREIIELKICKDHSPADGDIFKGILRICAQARASHQAELM